MHFYIVTYRIIIEGCVHQGINHLRVFLHDNTCKIMCSNLWRFVHTCIAYANKDSIFHIISLLLCNTLSKSRLKAKVLTQGPPTYWHEGNHMLHHSKGNTTQHFCNGGWDKDNFCIYIRMCATCSCSVNGLWSTECFIHCHIFSDNVTKNYGQRWIFTNNFNVMI